MNTDAKRTKKMKFLDSEIAPNLRIIDRLSFRHPNQQLKLVACLAEQNGFEAIFTIASANTMFILHNSLALFVKSNQL